MALFAIVSATSCGSGTPEVATVKPSTVKISGDLEGYVEVVQGEYEIVEDFNGKMSIKVKALKPMPEEELAGYYFELSASVLGENGSPVSGVNEFKADYGSREKLAGILRKGSGEITVQLESFGYMAEFHADKVKTFTVSSTKTAESKPEASNSSDKSASAGSEDFDKLLDQYEDYVDQYIVIAKKMKQGDAGAMEEYAGLLETTQEMSETVEDAKGEMSLEQSTRLLNIHTKMAKAM